MHTRSQLAIGLWTSIALLCLLSAGCANTAHNLTSTADFLYAGRTQAVASSAPVLSLPLSVGIAFVPGESGFAPSRMPVFVARAIGRSRGSMITEKQKVDLMKMVADRFSTYPFVRNVAIIPTEYLRQNGGFDNLDQIRASCDVDVMVLVAYDQTQFSDEGALALANLTVVGAFVVPGEKNETETMLDAVVLDVASRRILFRAPGTSHVKGMATFVNQSQELRSDSETGFRKATENLIENLDLQLAAFRDKVHKRPGEAVILRPEAPDAN